MHKGPSPLWNASGLLGQFLVVLLTSSVVAVFNGPLVAAGYLLAIVAASALLVEARRRTRTNATGWMALARFAALFVFGSVWASGALLIWSTGGETARALALLLVMSCCVSAVIFHHERLRAMVAALAPYLLTGGLIAGEAALQGNPSYAMGLSAVLLAIVIAVRHQFATRRQIREARLRADIDSNRAAAVLEICEAGYWDYDLRTGRFVMSDSLKDLLGVDEAAIMTANGPDFAQFEIEPFRTRNREAWQKAITSGETTIRTEHPIVRPDGLRLHILTRVGIHRNTMGRPVRLTAVTLDVTDREHAAEKIRRQAAENAAKDRRWRLATTNALSGIWTADIETGAFVASQVLADMLGVEDPHEITLFLVMNSIPAPWDIDIAAKMERLLATGEPYRLEHPLIGVDGVRRWVRTSVTVDRDADTGAITVMGFVTDITEHRRALEESERHAAAAERERTRWQTASQVAKAAAYEYTVDRAEYAADAQFEVVLGVTPEAVNARGGSLLPWIPEEARADFIASMRGALDAGERLPIGTEMVCRFPFDRPDGRRVWISLNSRVTGLSATGQANEVSGLLVDVTALHEAEMALENARRAAEDERERWDIAAEGAGAAAYEYDLEARRYLPSPRYEALIGESLERINTEFGGSMRHMVPEPWRTELAELMGRALANRGRCECEYPIVRPDGTQIWVRSLVFVRLEPGSARTRVFSFNIDITRQKESEERLVAARQAAEAARVQAEQANRAKSEFLATMSHEIRTPMNAILGMAELIGRADLDSEVREHVRTLRHSGQLLLTILNDLLDLSKIEAGRMEIEVIPTQTAGLLEQVTRLWRPRAEEKGLTFVVERSAATPDRFLADPSRLQQILFNLVSNAVKFTIEGAVTLRAEAGPVEDGRTLLRLSVRDEGVGMDADTLARLFQPFTQADASTSRRFGGTGLGLTISRRLADVMGGTLEVVSAPGEGSTFTLAIPVEVVDSGPVGLTPTDAPEAIETAEGLSILLAEDHPVNQKIALAFLAPFGHAVRVVGNGREAVEAARETAFDIILMDIQMPEMDGLSATEAIRTGGGPNAGTPIIGLTADAFEEQKRRGYAVGMTDYVTKPIDPRVLTVAITRAAVERATA
jgi:PAS domain S-box-containing protein